MTDKTYDLVIIGAGVFGLQLARQALLQNLSVCVLEAKNAGSGASGGLLGALMPHIPDRWNAKKQFQFEALVSLEDECENLSNTTQLPTGYGRIGRLMPLRDAHFINLASERALGARTYWQTGCFSFEKIEPPENWLNKNLAKYGAVLDTLAARLNPRFYIKALAHFVSNHPKGILLENIDIDPKLILEKNIITPKGKIFFENLTICTGHHSFSKITYMTQKQIGHGIKGQARLIKLDMPENTPIIYDDGCYIVPHDNGTVAVGSSSVKNWNNETKPDPEDWGFYDKALDLCPALKNAEIIGQWAGVRPKCYLREPAIGLIPGHKNIYLFTGGFKISFGIAHKAALCLLDEIQQNETDNVLPDTFKTAHHF